MTFALCTILFAAITHFCKSAYVDYPPDLEDASIASSSVPGGAASNAFIRLDRNALGAMIGTTDALVRRAVVSSIFGTGHEGTLHRTCYASGLPCNYSVDLATYPDAITNADAMVVLFGMDRPSRDYIQTMLVRTNLDFSAVLRIEDRLRKCMAMAVANDNIVCLEQLESSEDYWSFEPYGYSYDVEGSSYYPNGIIGLTFSACQHALSVTTDWGDSILTSDSPVIDTFFRDMSCLFVAPGDTPRRRSDVTRSLYERNAIASHWLYYGPSAFYDDWTALGQSGYISGDGAWDIVSAVTPGRAYTNFPATVERETRRIIERPWACANAFLAALDTVLVGPDDMPKIVWSNAHVSATRTLTYDYSGSATVAWDASSRRFKSSAPIAVTQTSSSAKTVIGLTSYEYAPRYVDSVEVGVLTGGASVWSLGIALNADAQGTAEYMRQIGTPVGEWLTPRVGSPDAAGNVPIYLTSPEIATGSFQLQTMLVTFPFEGSGVCSWSTACNGSKARMPPDETLRDLTGHSRPACYPHPSAMLYEDVGGISGTTLLAVGESDQPVDFAGGAWRDPTNCVFRLVGFTDAMCGDDIYGEVSSAVYGLETKCSDLTAAKTRGASAVRNSAESVCNGAYTTEPSGALIANIRAEVNTNGFAVGLSPTTVEQIRLTETGYELGTNGVAIAGRTRFTGIMTLDANANGAGISATRNFDTYSAIGEQSTMCGVRWDFDAMKRQ